MHGDSSVFKINWSNNILFKKNTGKVMFLPKLLLNLGLKNFSARLYHAQNQTSCDGH